METIATIILESTFGLKCNAAMKTALSFCSEHCKMAIHLSMMVTVMLLRVLLENAKYWWIGSVFAQAMVSAAKYA